MAQPLITVSLALSVLGAGSPAFAQAAQTTQPPQQTQPAKPAKDPNEIICERQDKLGSRLASERVCKTRAEWAEERRLNRQDIDKMQTDRDMSH